MQRSERTPYARTINARIRLLLEDPAFAASVLESLSAYFRGLATRDLGDGQRIAEVLTIARVPVWDLLQGELLQILEPELYRIVLVAQAIARLAPQEVLLCDEHPAFSRAVALCAISAGRPLHVVGASPAGRVLLDRRPRFPSASRRGGPAPARSHEAIRELLCRRAPKGKRTILVSTEWIANTQILRPLLERLAANPDLSVHFLRRSHRHDVSGIPLARVWELRDVCALGRDPDAPSLRREIATALGRIADGSAWTQLFHYGEVALEPLLRRKLRAVFSPQRIAAVVCQATALQRFLEQLRPDLIVDSDGILLTSVATDWAAADLGLRRLKVLHYDEQLFRMWSVVSAKSWDHVAVMGAAPKAAVIDLGVSAKKVFETGYPFFDERLAAISRASRKPPKSRLVLFTAQGLPEEAAVFSRILDAFGELPDHQLIARPHPLAPHSLDWAWRRRRRPPNVARAIAESLHDSIASCSLVITISSITALEAVLIGRPVLIVEPRTGFPHDPSLFYSSHGVGRALLDLGKLAETIRALCDEGCRGRRFRDGRRRIMEQYFAAARPSSGRSATNELERRILMLSGAALPPRPRSLQQHPRHATPVRERLR